jgi:hypothetical protein
LLLVPVPWEMRALQRQSKIAAYFLSFTCEHTARHCGIWLSAISTNAARELPEAAALLSEATAHLGTSIEPAASYIQNRISGSFADFRKVK